ncbi:MAG: LysR family transcriptional regulator [Alysiella sp.]|uniref:LysR family transcriptional regulator n=1 Tax=Alysiella sp. TaxID=1872483 RepID=UPI0026DB5119|nr:LysR family transcriptional regulator [Alysiella sp.]MDO4434524.1 LysR family transcriptional regulator [Alysiella sp.]
MISLDQMAMFVALVQNGSFAKTAEKLSIPQSTLSRKINELEHNLGLKLLHRTTRKMDLTEAGQFYFERAAAIVHEAECTHQMLNGMKIQPDGVLKMSVPVEFAHDYLAQWLPEFRTRYPKISVQIDVSPHKADLMTNGVDLVVRAGEIREPHLIAHQLMTTDFYLYASKSYLQENGIPTSISDLAHHDCLAFQGVKQWTLWHNQYSETVQIDAAYQSNSFTLLMKWAQANMGIALLPEMVVSPDDRNLVKICPDWQGQSVPIAILTATRLLPLKVKCMVAFLREKVEKRTF